MISVKDAVGTPYEAPGHFGVYGIKKITPDQSQKFMVNVSYFAPNGGCDMGAGPIERIYYIVNGNMECNGKNGEKHVLGPGDLIYIAAGEERDMKVIGGKPCEVLVVLSKP